MATRIVMAHTGTTSINPSLYANPGYDPRKDFTPIGLISSTPIVLMAHPSFAAKSVAELIALAKKEPGKLNLGTPPPGTGGYLAAELFKSMAGLDVTIVPYKGTAALTNDLLGGHVPIGFNVLAPAMGNLRAGGLRAIATAGPTRTSLFPDVPTFDRVGAAGLRGGAALRPAGAGRHAERHHRAAQRRTAQARRLAGGAASASPPTAAIRCRRARRTTPPTSTARKRSGRR